MIFAGNVQGWRLFPLIFANVVEVNCSEVIRELDWTMTTTNENVGILVDAEGREAASRRWLPHRGLDWTAGHEV